MKQFNKTSALRKIKFQKNKNTYIKRLSISLSCLILLFVVILFTFARFETSSDEYDLINGQVKNVCEYEIGHEWTYNYTGNIEEFSAPCNGEYKLEVWGAQGGRSGGNGGYSTGNINLSLQKKLYIGVGGAGGNGCSPGYNGGGYGTKGGGCTASGSGGGASHIAINNNLGVLSNYSSNSSRSDILIVAGGGGGNDENNNKGGAGGGLSGINGSGANTGKGATQNAGGASSCNMVGSFGQGASASDTTNWSGYRYGGGGGGGFYGGGGGCFNTTSSGLVGAGGGGSGYVGSIKNGNTINGISSMPTHDGTSTMIGNTANGYAKITLVSTTDYVKVSCDNLIGKSWDFNYTGNSQEFKIQCNGEYKLETWGAQGGSGYNTNKTAVIGGYGAYSVGNISLNNSNNLYIYVGEQGPIIKPNNSIIESTDYYAFPNGGAVKLYQSSVEYVLSGGGGSTHIAKENKLISDLPSNSNSLLIVAGAGGGTTNYWSIIANGGSGGGYIGNSASPNYMDVIPTGGSQNAGGLGGGNQNNHNQSGEWLAGKYGIGGGSLTWGSASPANVSGGGGGGYYGGGASWGGSGAGGSGYIGNNDLTSKHMTCYNCVTSNETNTKTISNTCHNTTPTPDCAKEGNGYARITYISK